MTIDGTDISTFGLIVQKVSGYTNLQALKKILDEREFLANDIKGEEREVVVKLFGQYASSAALETGINGLKSLLESDVEHDYIFPNRSIAFVGVAKRGFKTSIFRLDASLLLTIGIVTPS